MSDDNSLFSGDAGANGLADFDAKRAQAVEAAKAEVASQSTRMLTNELVTRRKRDRFIAVGVMAAALVGLFLLSRTIPEKAPANAPAANSPPTGQTMAAQAAPQAPQAPAPQDPAAPAEDTAK